MLRCRRSTAEEASEWHCDGLIKEGDRVAILSDILGNEDHLGDMDFKVCGTRDGITACQMDMKIKALILHCLKRCLCARDGRLHILAKMDESTSKPKSEFTVACYVSRRLKFLERLHRSCYRTWRKRSVRFRPMPESRSISKKMERLLLLHFRAKQATARSNSSWVSLRNRRRRNVCWPRDASPRRTWSHCRIPAEEGRLAPRFRDRLSARREYIGRDSGRRCIRCEAYCSQAGWKVLAFAQSISSHARRLRRAARAANTGVTIM